MKYQIIVFVDGSNVSRLLLNYINKVKKFQIKLIILSPNCDIKIKKQLRLKYKKKIKVSDLKNIKIVDKMSSFLCDMIFSYYDFKIPVNILNSLKIGGINFHPSYLPYNKGRHSTFWAINNNTPFGVSSHWMEEDFDTGDIFIQKRLKFDKFENAKIIYNEKVINLKSIIKKTINLISEDKFIRKKQRKIKSYHYAWDIKNLININLNKKIPNTKFANLIRSTCFDKNTGLYLNYKKKNYFIVSKYKVKKTRPIKEYDIQLLNIFKNLSSKKIIKYKIHCKNYELNIVSKIQQISYSN